MYEHPTSCRSPLEPRNSHDDTTSSTSQARPHIRKRAPGLSRCKQRTNAQPLQEGRPFHGPHARCAPNARKTKRRKLTDSWSDVAVMPPGQQDQRKGGKRGGTARIIGRPARGAAYSAHQQRREERRDADALAHVNKRVLETNDANHESARSLETMSRDDVKS